MTASTPDCILCDPDTADARLGRLRLWEDDLWRLSASLRTEVPGFCYLESKRHIPQISALDGAEAVEFGPTLARVTRALKAVTGAEVVYVYLFGSAVPHLHVHLGPHLPGDALNSSVIRGGLIERVLPSGASILESQDFEKVPEDELRAIGARIQTVLRVS